MPTPFQIEAWTEYALGMLIIIARIAVRCKNLGFNWEGDDYFTIAVVLFFAGEMVCLESIGQLGSITGMSDEKALQLTPEQTQRIIRGSKFLLAGWVLYTSMIWSLKACMLFFYSRFTLNTSQRTLVKVTGGVCIVAYLATLIVYFTHCRPIYHLWQVYPYPGDDCALNNSNSLAVAITNICTDLMILYIPLPLLWTVKLPMKTKILCGFWLCSGIFIMVATLLRCVLSLKDPSQVNNMTIWSCRETFVGVIAVNLPVLKPFLNKAKRILSSGRLSSKGATGSSGHGMSKGVRLSVVDRSKKSRTVHDIRSLDDSSEEQIAQETKSITESQLDLMENGHAPGSTGTRSDGGESGIQITRTYEVSRSSEKRSDKY